MTRLNTKNLMTLREVAELVGLSSARVRELSRIAMFPGPIRVGLRALRWRPEEVERWLATRPPA